MVLAKLHFSLKASPKSFFGFAFFTANQLHLTNVDSVLCSIAPKWERRICSFEYRTCELLIFDSVFVNV